MSMTSMSVHSNSEQKSALNNLAAELERFDFHSPHTFSFFAPLQLPPLAPYRLNFGVECSTSDNLFLKTLEQYNSHYLPSKSIAILGCFFLPTLICPL